MSLDTLHQNQLLPTDQGPLQQTPAILLCENSLVRAGIRHILDGTPFMVAEELEDSSGGLASPDAAPALYIIHDSHSADALAEMVADVKAACPSRRVVVLADGLDPTTMMRALQAGMNGLCSTRMGRDALIKALELVMLGETFIAPAFTLSLADEASRRQQTRPDGAIVVGPAAAAIANKLSPREAQILRHLTQGASNKHIARELGLAEATIKVHLKAILRKVRAANRTQAAIWAQQHMSLPANDGFIIAAE
jgi:two-component system nitrate/nitrite response regulator NarL